MFASSNSVPPTRAPREKHIVFITTPAVTALQFKSALGVIQPGPGILQRTFSPAGKKFHALAIWRLSLAVILAKGCECIFIFKLKDSLHLLPLSVNDGNCKAAATLQTQRSCHLPQVLRMSKSGVLRDYMACPDPHSLSVTALEVKLRSDS
ncbi:hypothetical protein JEQ12_013796 [Ovis aries]|uniref:Uncharacterized protein n=1 Tax=Ovis aries TaxID=9940 RepID=A0A836A8W6_SHEEP|nr:hypothetical protein JEQ12_013796 [Ovis aries]